MKGPVHANECLRMSVFVRRLMAAEVGVKFAGPAA